jgi:hypothetical protein
MRKAGLWLLVASGLLVSSSVWAEDLLTTRGFVQNATVVDKVIPGAPPAGVTITGWQPSEFSQGIALRLTTNELYLVGSTGRLYRLNPTTGVATQVGAPFVPALNGTEFGVGFDNADHLRVVSNTGQNLRIDPATGAVTLDTPLAFAPGDASVGKTPQVGAIAFDPRHGGTTGYAVDDQHGLLRFGSATASDGLLFTIASTASFVGLTISPETGTAYGLEPGYSSVLDTLDLTTGVTTQLGFVGGQFVSYRGLAMAPGAGPVIASVPTLSWQGLALLAFALALSALWLRRKPRPARG